MLEELMFFLDLFEDEELLEDFLTNDKVIFSEENPFDKLQEYLEQYGDLYSFQEQLEISHNLFYVYDDMESMNRMPPYIYAEIMAHCGILPNRFNYYSNIFENIKQSHNDILDKNILDVGCGHYPAFVEMVAREIHEKEKNGRIDGIDPKLIITSINNLKNTTLFKDQFTNNTNIDNYDLLTGIMPCEATEELIRKACTEEKELVLIPCGCHHPIFGKVINNSNNYVKFLNKMLKKYKSNAFSNELNYFMINGDEVPILNLIKK